MSAENSILLLLQKLSGGVVNNYKFENESNFTAMVRARSGYSADRHVSFYNRWCSNWIQRFSQETSTNWIVRYTYPRVQKSHFKKVYKCQHNSFDKVKKRKRGDISRERNKGCDATITIIFKKINRHTIRNDPLLRQELDVRIQINYHHTHKINVVESNRYLRMTPDTQETFFKYFDGGMTPTAARGFHEIKLEFGTDVLDVPVVLANAQINPTERQVKHLYCKWRKEHSGRRDSALQDNVSPEFFDFMPADVETRNELLNYTEQINKVGHHNYNSSTEMNTVDGGEDHPAATGFNEIKLENETDGDDELPVILANEQVIHTKLQVKHFHCEWKEEHCEGAELPVDVSPEFYDDMSVDMETKNEFPIDTEQINILGDQDDNFTTEIINTVHYVDETNICKEHSAAVIELSEHLKRIREIASNSKTVDMTNAIKKFNKILAQITTPTDLLNFVHT